MGETNIRLRLAAAIDFREEITIEASLGSSGKRLGSFDIRYAHPFQPFEIIIAPEFVDAINKQGIALWMSKGEKDSWFFAPDKTQTSNQGLQPHLLVGTNSQPEAAFKENLLSINSLGPFGWIGGCVLDALWEQANNGNKEAARILELQLSKFLDPQKGIVFENPRTEPLDGSFNSIEDFLPFAAINGMYPDHPSIQMAVDYLLERENQQGLILSGTHVSTEGCYTVAYPLASIAVSRNDEHLADKALAQILLRTQYLTDANAIYQRSDLSGHQAFANWGRGIAWYLLGSVKTLSVLMNSDFKSLAKISQAKSDLRQAVKLVYRWQAPEGFWCSFIDRKETGIDTSATSGIATAIAIAGNLDIVDTSYLTNLDSTYQKLKEYLTPDGFLTHVSQINRGGEALQASGYRVMSQFGLGLLAQLQYVLQR